MNRPVVVIKVGGSLLDWPQLPERLGEVLRHPDLGTNRPLLIAGGGGVVDALRRLDGVHSFGEPTAHALALHALDLDARILARIGRRSKCRVVESLDMAARCWTEGGVPVLAPRLELGRDDRRNDDALPHSWDVTSDSIAARVAVLARARALWLLKSADLPEDCSRAEATRLGLVDPHFVTTSATLRRVRYANVRGEGEVCFRDL